MTAEQPAPAEVISYLRRGRKLRASGAFVEWDANRRMTKVKPLRDSWGMIWLSEEEIDAGRNKPQLAPRKAPVEPRPRKPRKPLPPPIPEWKRLVERVRVMEIDNAPDGWPAVKMSLISAMADEIERMAAMLANYLPLNAGILP